jgi:hypothetical protein
VIQAQIRRLLNNFPNLRIVTGQIPVGTELVPVEIVFVLTGIGLAQKISKRLSVRAFSRMSPF